MYNVKKLLALLIAVLMLIGLAGCGEKEESPTETKETGQSEPAQIDEDLTVHENTFFTVGYNEEDGWVLE